MYRLIEIIRIISFYNYLFLHGIRAGHQSRVTICSHYPAQKRPWLPTGRFDPDQHHRRHLNPLIPPLCAVA